MSGNQWFEKRYYIKVFSSDSASVGLECRSLCTWN